MMKKLHFTQNYFNRENNFFMKLTFLIVCLWQTNVLNAQVVINEVYPDMDRVELKNIGTTTIDVSTYWFCDRPTYARVGNSSLITVISGSLNMAPGEITVLDFFYNSNTSNSRGELALYRTSGFGFSTAILDYVTWGEKIGSTRESIAVDAGIWTTNDAAASIPSGQSLQYDGDGDTSSDWTAAAPTLGADTGTLSVDEFGNEINLKIFPNPTTDIINISFNSNTLLNESKIELINLAGQKILSKKITNSETSINLKAIEAGVYFINLVDSSRGILSTKKIIKK